MVVSSPPEHVVFVSRVACQVGDMPAIFKITLAHGNIRIVLAGQRVGCDEHTSAMTPPVGLRSHCSGISKLAGCSFPTARAGTQDTIIVGCLKPSGHSSFNEVNTDTTFPVGLNWPAHELKCAATLIAFWVYHKDFGQRWEFMPLLGPAYRAIVNKYPATTHLNHCIDCCSCHSPSTDNQSCRAWWLNYISWRSISSQASHLRLLTIASQYSNDIIVWSRTNATHNANPVCVVSIMRKYWSSFAPVVGLLKQWLCTSVKKLIRKLS
jgi:hypothetical protein